MVYESEIYQIKQTLKSNFADPNDKKYWQDKLADLERKQASAKANQEYFTHYEKGVKAFKDTRGW